MALTRSQQRIVIQYGSLMYNCFKILFLFSPLSAHSPGLIIVDLVLNISLEYSSFFSKPDLSAPSLFQLFLKLFLKLIGARSPGLIIIDYFLNASPKFTHSSSSLLT